MHGRYMSSITDYKKDYAKRLKYRLEDDDLISEFDQETLRSYNQGSGKACWRLSCKFEVDSF